MDTACNGIVLLRCAQLHIIPHHSSGQGLLAGIFGGNVEHIIILVTAQIDFSTVLRHGLIRTVFVLILDLAVLVAKGQDTGTGAALMVKGHGKLCRVFCFDLTLQTVDGHADQLGKAAIFLAIRGLVVAYQIALIHQLDVQFLLVGSSSSIGDGALIIRVGALYCHFFGICIIDGDFLVFAQINIIRLTKLICILQSYIRTAVTNPDTIGRILNSATVDFCFTRAITSYTTAFFRVGITDHSLGTFFINYQFSTVIGDYRPH